MKAKGFYIVPSDILETSTHEIDMSLFLRGRVTSGVYDTYKVFVGGTEIDSSLLTYDADNKIITIDSSVEITSSSTVKITFESDFLPIGLYKDNMFQMGIDTDIEQYDMTTMLNTADTYGFKLIYKDTLTTDRTEKNGCGVLLYYDESVTPNECYMFLLYECINSTVCPRIWIVREQTPLPKSSGSDMYLPRGLYSIYFYNNDPICGFSGLWVNKAVSNKIEPDLIPNVVFDVTDLIINKFKGSNATDASGIVIENNMTISDINNMIKNGDPFNSYIRVNLYYLSRLMM